MHTYIHTNSTELVSSSILRIEQRMNISQNATTTKVVCVCITCEYYKNTEQNKWSFLPVFTEKKLIFSFFSLLFSVYRLPTFYSYSRTSPSVSLFHYWITYNMCMVENIQLEKLLRARKKVFYSVWNKKSEIYFYSYLVLCTHKSKKL